MTFLDTLKDIALPFVMVAAVAEGLWFLIARKKYDWTAWATSAGDLIVRRLLGLVPFALVAPVFAWAYAHRLYTFHLRDIGSVLLLFVGLEFCYYWQHRASHTIRWFWNAHLVHHSPNQLTLAAAYRLGWFDKFIGTGVFLTPLSFLGFHPLDVVAALFLNLLYQFWLHTDWIPKLGVLEYVLNTPSAHRVHHARNPAYLDANFGGVLIVFDRLFGTYVEERDDLPCQYGLVHPVTTYNPVRINLQPWIELGRDLTRARSLGEAWNYLFGAPGWRPDGQGMTTADLRAADLRAAGLEAAD